MNTEPTPSHHGDDQAANSDNTIDHPGHAVHDQQPGIGDAYVADVIDDAPDADAAHRLDEIYARHGTPFAVYLSLTDIDHYATDIETAFHDSYIATYDQRDYLIDDTIDTFGWKRDLTRRLEGDPLLASVVRFDRDAIWGFIGDHYQIVELAHKIYLFEPAP